MAFNYWDIHSKKRSGGGESIWGLGKYEFGIDKGDQLVAAQNNIDILMWYDTPFFFVFVFCILIQNTSEVYSIAILNKLKYE
jgi:hypothetical protein